MNINSLLTGVSLALATAVVGTVAATTSMATPPTPVITNVGPSQVGDSLAFYVSWSQSKDSLGAASQYRMVVYDSTHKKILTNIMLVPTNFVQKIAIPVPPDSTIKLSFSVTAYRNNVASNTLGASASYTVHALPPVTPAVAPNVDSVKLFSMKADSIAALNAA